MKWFENVKQLDFLVSFKLIFENVNIGLIFRHDEKNF